METLVASKTTNPKSKRVPDALIYEIDEGKPIYYRGYRAVLSGKLKIEDIMGSSKKQSLLVGELFFLLKLSLRQYFYFFTNELGIKFGKSSRSADIALVLKSKMAFDEAWEDKYASTMPDIIIEVDIKADLTDMPDASNYFFKKTEQLLNNGTSKVIWIFTESETIMVAEQGKARWEIMKWTEDVEVSHGFSFNIPQLLAQLKNG